MSVKSGPKGREAAPQVSKLRGHRHAFQRDLGASQLTLLTLGGIMGSGLFLASGIAIRRSGPAVLLVFLVAAIAMTLEIIALGEMSAADPTAGSFLVYAERVYGPGMTFIGGWVFWFSSVLTMSSEVTAASMFTQVWWPAVPLWVWAVGYSAGIVGANFISVRGFGSIEGVMSGVKVGAVTLFLVVAGLFLMGLLPHHPVAAPALSSVSSWWPHGVTGPLSSLILVLFAFAGTGVIGIAAAETEKPPLTIRRSLMATIPLVWVFYLGSVMALLAIVPWNRTATASSPFVQAVHVTGLPWVGHIMNLVLLFAVLSTMNAALYSNSRVLYTLGKSGQAPASLARLNRKGIPARGILWSAALLALTIVLAYVLPRKAYSYLVTATGFQAMFIWLVVLLTHLRYRPYLEQKKKQALEFKLPGYPWTTYLTLALVALGMMGAPLASSELVGLSVAAGFIVLVGIIYLVLRSRLSAAGGPPSG